MFSGTGASLEPFGVEPAQAPCDESQERRRRATPDPPGQLSRGETANGAGDNGVEIAAGRAEPAREQPVDAWVAERAEAGELQHPTRVLPSRLNRPLVLHRPHPLGHAAIADPSQGATECRRSLDGAEAEERHIREFLTPILRAPQALGAVLDDEEPVSPSDVDDRRELDSAAEEMRDDKEARPRQ